MTTELNGRKGFRTLAASNRRSSNREQGDEQVINIIYYVRHAQNKANITKEFSYLKVDYPLTSQGIEQAQRVARFFLDKNISAIFSSPLKRAAQTAEIISQTLSLPVVVVEELRELNVGILEDLPPSEETWNLHDRILLDWFEGRSEVTFPGGENYFMALARMKEGLKRTIANRNNESIIVVGHYGLLLATISNICQGIEPKALAQLSNCSMSEIELRANADYSDLQGNLIAWGTLNSESIISRESGSL